MKAYFLIFGTLNLCQMALEIHGLMPHYVINQGVDAAISGVLGVAMLVMFTRAR